MNARRERDPSQSAVRTAVGGRGRRRYRTTNERIGLYVGACVESA